MAEKVLISNGKHTIHKLLVIIAVKLVPIYFYIYLPLYLSLCFWSDVYCISGYCAYGTSELNGLQRRRQRHHAARRWIPKSYHEK